MKHFICIFTKYVLGMLLQGHSGSQQWDTIQNAPIALWCLLPISVQSLIIDLFRREETYNTFCFAIVWLHLVFPPKLGLEIIYISIRIQLFCSFLFIYCESMLHKIINWSQIRHKVYVEGKKLNWDLQMNTAVFMFNAMCNRSQQIRSLLQRFLSPKAETWQMPRLH